MKFFALAAFVAVLGFAAAAPTRGLKEDLHEFVELIPIEEIKAVAKRYIETDAEVQQIIAYLQGEEWQKVITTIREHPTWQEFKEYLNEAGIDIEAIIQAIHDWIAGAGNKNTVQAAGSRSLRQFVDEILALVPFSDLANLLSDKLENSHEFLEFFEKISSEKSYAFVEEIRALPEVQRIADVLRGMGIDVDKVLAVVYELLGWEV